MRMPNSDVGLRRHLIVGLGNPGEKYRSTRHNVGFMVVDRVAETNNISLAKQKFQAVFGAGRINDVPVVIAQPMTFMNRSGTAVKSLSDFCGLKSTDIIVIHDDLDLALGAIRIKEKGGHGGHNGLRSVMEVCGTDAFMRIRVGIGRPPGTQAASEYVLDQFDTEQKSQLSHIVNMAAEAVEFILFQGAAAAKNRFHQKSNLKPYLGREL